MLSRPAASHPLFRRINAAPGNLRDRTGLWLLLGFFFLCFLWLLIMSSRIASSAALALTLPLVIPVIVNLRALGWVLDVCAALGREQDQGRWTLLALVPQGIFALSMTIAAGWMHRNNGFRSLHLLVGVLALLVAALLLAVPTDLPERAGVSPALLMGETVALFYLDFFQSVALAIVAGISGGTAMRNRHDARNVGMALFALSQVLVYVVVAYLGFGLLPQLFRRRGWNSPEMEFTLAFVRFVLLLGLRELVILSLWHRLTQQFAEIVAPRAETP